MYCLNDGYAMRPIPDSEAQECPKCRQVQVATCTEGGIAAVFWFTARSDAELRRPQAFKQKTLFGGD
jgi:hypothetical protein